MRRSPVAAGAAGYSMEMRRVTDLPLLLVVDGRPVAPLEVAGTWWRRGRGLLGRRHVDGALWMPGTRSIHSFAMRMTLDVARCDRELVVVEVLALVPGRLVGPRRGVCHVIEAAAGSFDRWGLAPGSRLDTRRSDVSSVRRPVPPGPR